MQHYILNKAEAAELNDRCAAMFSAIAMQLKINPHIDYAADLSEKGILTITED